MSAFKKPKTEGGWGSSTNDDDWGSSNGDGGWGSNDNANQGSSDRPRFDRDRGGFSGERGGRGGGRGRGRGRGGGPRGPSRDTNDDGGWGSSSGGGGDGGGWGSSGSSAPSKRPNNSSDDGGWGSSTGGGRDDGGWGSSSAPSRENKSRNDNPSDDGGWGSSTGGGGGWGGNSAPPRENKPRNDNPSGGGGWGSSAGEDGGWGGGGGSAQNNSDGGGGGGWGDGDDKSAGRGNRGEPRGDRPEGDRPAPYKPEEIDLDEEAKFNETEAGEHFEQYCDQAVTCVPPGVVQPISTFSDVIKSELLLSHLEKANYKRMTPIQKWAMPALLGGFDIIGCAQTGSGKTAAFILPVLQNFLIDSKDAKLPNNADQDLQEPSCLIIAPTRELARQLHNDALRWSRDTVIKCQVIYGGISTTHLKLQITKGCNLLVATPGRLKDFVNKNWIGFRNIKYIILDEGDRLIDDGFLNDIREILSHESMPPQEQRQTLFFSATFKPETQKVARELMSQKFVFVTVGRVGSANNNITQQFVQVSRAEKKRELKRILGEVPDDQKTIIFTQTKAAADMLAGYFTALNLSATSIHGDRHQQQREEAIRQFKRGERRFLISSPVGNRGLDLPKVYLVINYDLPNNIDEYVHRIGRTGRAGHPGKAISFYDQERDTEILSELVALLKEANQEVPDYFTSSASNGDFTESTSGNDGGWGDSASAAPAAEAEDDGW